MAADQTVSCRQLNATAIETTARRGDGSAGVTRWELTNDGAVLTTALTYPDAQGLSKSEEEVYLRASGANGFSGEWLDARPFKSQPSVLEMKAKGNVLYYAFPEFGQHADLPLNGSGATVLGPGLPAELKLAIRQINSQELLIEKKLNGSVINLIQLKVGTDGRTVIETYWRPERPDQRAQLVYEKQ